MDWCHAKRIDLRYIQPGTPDQDAFIARFNRSYREKVSSACRFDNLGQVREITHARLYGYNGQCPHDPLAGLPPAQFRRAGSRDARRDDARDARRDDPEHARHGAFQYAWYDGSRDKQ